MTQKADDTTFYGNTQSFKAPVCAECFNPSRWAVFRVGFHWFCSDCYGALVNRPVEFARIARGNGS